MADDSILWWCMKCNDTFTSTPERHSKDRCDCGETWVDHEKYYLRRSFNLEKVSDADL